MAYTVCLILGFLLVADSCMAGMVCNMNLGVVLPGIIGLPLLLIGLFRRTAQRFFSGKIGKTVLTVLCAGYFIFAVSFGFVTAKIVRSGQTAPQPGADCVIVLGAAVRGELPSLTLKNRLDTAAAYLQDNTTCAVIVTGGRGQGENRTEAEVSKEYLLRCGISAERIFLEERSTSTQENLENAREILKKEFRENPRLVLVSSDYHLYRAGLVARELGLETELLGSPSVRYLIPNFYLREYAAVIGYRLLGRLG